MENFAQNLNANIIPVKGLGEPIIVPSRKPVPSDAKLFSAGISRMSWKLFLNTYKEKLLKLSVPDLPPSRYLSSLDFTDLDIWTTLFPVAAVLRKKYRNTEVTAPQILREVRNWALEVIDMNLH